MKKIINSFVSFAVLLTLAAPGLVGATTSTSTASELSATLQQQIATLKAQMDALNAQLTALKAAQKAVQETAQEIKSTLQLAKQLRLGMSGDDVKLLQQFLATDHDIYPEGLITGYFGSLTQKAVRKLQAKLCVSQVGQVGPTTLWRINELLTEGAGKSGKVPPGLLTAPGIQKKLCGTATTTPDTTAPVISNVIATSTTASTTLINWTTDESANSKVWYSSATPVNITATSTPVASSSDYLLAHEIGLIGLNPGTAYYYVVSSADKSGNMATSTEKLFITVAQ